MTKVELSFRLLSPIDEAQAERLSDTHRIYGIIATRLDRNLQDLVVEYDASRLSAQDVEAALARAGLPLAQTE